jgi:hypothetical protein
MLLRNVSENRRNTRRHIPEDDTLHNHRHETSYLTKLTVDQPVKIVPATYGTRRFITVFTRARFMFLFGTKCLQYIYDSLDTVFNLLESRNVKFPTVMCQFKLLCSIPLCQFEIHFLAGRTAICI